MDNLENQPAGTNDPGKEEIPSINEILFKSLISMYIPVNTPAPDVEFLSTIDILEELSSICDVEKSKLVTALSQSGFSLYHNDAGSFWLLKRK